jgi:hypothetical protein
MIKAFRKLWNSEKGSTLIIAGAALPMLVGAAGLATDTIQWALWKRELQRAADSGALAGVYDRNIKGDTDETEAAVLHDLTINHHTGINWVNDPDVTFPADDADMENQVRVVLTIRKSLPFSSLFMETAPIIEAAATAASVPGGDTYCVIALDRRASVVGIEIAGSATLNMGECSLIANSTHPNKAASNGSSSATGGQGSSVTAKSLAAAGAVQNSTSWDVDNYDPYSTPADDPFSDLEAPPQSDCTKNITINGANDLDRSAADVSGDVVCINNLAPNGRPSGLTVGGDIVLGSATYVLNGGDLTMNNNNASLTCDGCTIVLTDFADPTKAGNIKLTGGQLNLVAPTDDGEEFQGVAIFQDRRATDSGQKTQNQINGNSVGGVTGAVYIPNQSLLYNGGGNLTALCLQIVAGRVEFSGNSLLEIATNCAGAPDTSGGRRVRLVA